MQVNGYTRELVLELIKSAHTYYETGMFSHQETVTRSVLGTLYQNALDDDILSVNAASARLGITAIDHSSLICHSLRRDELLTQSKIVANAVDLMVTSIIDRETFGNGRDTTEKIASAVTSPVLGLTDEIFSSQAALSEILGLYQQLGGIEGRKIVLSWGFGSRFSLPNLPHSLLLFLPLLGADLQVSTPSEFGLLNRVKREAEKVAEETGCTVTFTDQFDSISQDTDAVIALNWCRLDDYQKPERNTDFAQNYRDWYFSDDSIPANCAFLSPPPIQTDLIADEELLARSSMIHEGWLRRKIAILACTIQELQTLDDKATPLHLL